MPDATRGAWFNDARFGMFIHWGAYAKYARGEQVMMREGIDQNKYARECCAWNPKHYDPARWAAAAKEAGMRYAVLTTRHHDGYCLWDSQFTDYSSAAQAPRRDFVREYVEAFRAAGLHVGLYYSLLDMRIPAIFDGPKNDPDGWARFRDYCHNQVRELLTNYGRIDEFWFDGAWPRSQGDWRSRELLAMMRELQPDMLVNNRLGSPDPGSEDAEASKGLGAGESADMGDFSTPEQHITPDKTRRWESCQTTQGFWWGYFEGERWHPAESILMWLCDCSLQGGNLLLNVGPDGEGRLPEPFVTRTRQIGQWLKHHREALEGTEAASVIESTVFGRVTRKGNTLYLLVTRWPHADHLNVPGLATPIRRATLLTTGAELAIENYGRGYRLSPLPVEPPCALAPVIKLELDGEPEKQMWCGVQWGDASLAREAYAGYARTRGTSVWTDGKER